MKRYAYDKDTDEFLLTQKLYYLFDELGSVTAITGSDGMPVKYYLYDPFGNVTNTTNDPGNNLCFVGRYGGWKDWDVGFINFWHRWYDSELGKWTTRDPIGVRGGVNLYAYTENNPVNYIDVVGLYYFDPYQYVKTQLWQEVQALHGYSKAVAECVFWEVILGEIVQGAASPVLNKFKLIKKYGIYGRVIGVFVDIGISAWCAEKGYKKYLQ